MEANSVSKDTNSERSWSAYKRAQVRCKQAPVEDMASLPGFVDFCRGHDDRILRLKNPTGNGRSFYHGPMYGISGFPGFVYCPQALSGSVQTELAFQAVTEVCEVPHATNIELVAPKSTEEVNGPHESMWSLWKAEHGFEANPSSCSNTTPSTFNKTTPPTTAAAKKKYRSFRKLSWATTGYHYDWTQRSYHEGAKSPMPDSLNNLATLFARTALAMESSDCSSTKAHDVLQFTPSASIVNYYTLKSIMGGHRDDLEYALDKPVISISLGLPAIFLLGGKTKDETPVLPILVRAGDVMMLGGDARLNFHGMARVLCSAEPSNLIVSTCASDLVTPPSQRVSNIKCPGHDDGESAEQQDKHSHNEQFSFPDENDEISLQSFLSQHRININVRQVHKD